MDNIGLIIGIVVLAIGALQCFAGYKTFKSVIRLIAFFTCLLLGSLISFSKGASFPVSLIIGVVAGIICAIIAYKLYKVGVFVKAFIDGFLVSAVIGLGMSNISNSNMASVGDLSAFQSILITSIIIGIIVGIVAVIFVKPVIIISSSFTGGALCSAGLLLAASLPDNLVAILTFVFFTLGIIVQIKTTGGFLEKKESATNTNEAIDEEI